VSIDVQRDQAKQAAIEQWTADPCGSSVAAGEQGSREYFENLLQSRDDYGLWMHEALDYAGTRGLRVLDVGCGQGIDVYRYAAAGADAVGVDLTPRHVELARLHTAAMGVTATIVEGDAEALPFPDASFDRVSSNGVLHHTPNMAQALKEIRRVLKPGGETRIIVYNRNSFHYWLTQVLWQGIARGWLFSERSMAGVLSRGVEYSSIDARPLVNVYSPRAVESMLREAGFDGVTSTVRHFNASDTPITHVLHGRFGLFSDRATLDRLGRIGGWYVVGRGLSPS
jgi:ubiquinone/menaquinone biosynthesis C-methylase UbiE